MKKYNPLSPSLRETLQLYRQGFNIQQIANTRSLAIGTVEDHVCNLIKWHKIKINDLVSEELQALITPLIFSKNSLTEVKESLDGVDWFTIKCVRSAIMGKLTRQNIK